MDIQNLPHPEDLEENDLVLMFVKVTAEHIRVSTNFTKLAADTDPWSYQAEVLGRAIERSEAPLERWLDNAACLLPEWALWLVDGSAAAGA